MRRSAYGLIVGCLLLFATGCVERRFVVQTNPPGAVVFLNGQELSPAPADGTFTYYGTYHFTLVHDGFETTHIEQRIEPPWWAYPPFDFIVEHVWPFEVEDVRRFEYTLNPKPQPNAAELLREGEALRARGRTLPPPTAPRYPEFNP